MQINDLKAQLDQLSLFHKKTIRDWNRACEEIYEDSLKQLSKKDKEISRLKEQLNKSYEETTALYQTITEIKAANANLKKQLDEKNAQNQKLKAQINKDYKNSSKPSSATPNHGKINNGRKSEGKKRGGQKGHQSHCRKKYEPTKTIVIEPKPEYLDTTKYRATGKIIKKQLIKVALVITIEEYQTQEYRCLSNRHKVHAPFPEGVVNEDNFDSSVQAMAFLLNNHYTNSRILLNYI